MIRLTGTRDGVTVALNVGLGVNGGSMGTDTANEMIAYAIELWDGGYRRVDDDNPCVVRWHSVHGQAEHPPKTIPREIWFFFRGAYFGIGDHETHNE